MGLNATRRLHRLAVTIGDTDAVTLNAIGSAGPGGRWGVQTCRGVDGAHLVSPNVNQRSSVINVSLALATISSPAPFFSTKAVNFVPNACQRARVSSPKP